MVIISLTQSVYYNMYIAWVIGLIVACFNDPLPWTTCDNGYNTPSCHTGQYMYSLSREECTDLNMTAARNGICYSNETTLYGFWDISLAENDTNITTNFKATSEYFNLKLYGSTNGINFENIGSFKWEATILFMSAWMINYFAKFGGLRSSSLVSCFTASYSFIGIIVFTAYFATLEGAAEGMVDLYHKADLKFL